MRVEVKIEDADATEEVEVIVIHVEVGATVSDGQALMEVATDKANMDLAAPVAGVVEELLVAEGDIVPADRVFAVLRDD
jgi:pyruvate/2-oxoglutarate dehydrogenase complex dihydrolipoamide acyltransferase (E2) component